MSTEILNNSSKIREKNTSSYRVDISKLKRKIILKQRKEKLKKNILLATVCVGLTTIGYLII